MEKKLFMLFFVGILIISFASALDSQGVGKQSQNFTLTQTCSDATYITLSTIQYPDKHVETLNANMSLIGGQSFQYNFTDTSQIGRYDVTGISDGCENTFAFYFLITPSGQSGNDNIVFFVFVIIFLVGLNILFFFNRNIPLTILTGLFTMFLGVYLVNNGIIIYRDNLTNIIAYVVVGIGAITSLWATLEEFEVI